MTPADRRGGPRHRPAPRGSSTTRSSFILPTLSAPGPLSAAFAAAIAPHPRSGYKQPACDKGNHAMPTIEEIRTYHDELTLWRRDIHAHPELGFEERRTSDLVADKLAGFGIEVHR